MCPQVVDILGLRLGKSFNLISKASIFRKYLLLMLPLIFKKYVTTELKNLPVKIWNLAAIFPEIVHKNCIQIE